MGALKLEDLPRYTYEDYITWEGDWELIDGIAFSKNGSVSMAPAPMIKHQSISNKIARYLDEALEDCEKCQALLPIDWKITDETIVQPDNSVVCINPNNKAYITKAPKIIFEILSKSTAKKDKEIKYELYQQEGVKYYIIVNPDDEMANVYELKDGKYIKICDATDEIVEFNIKECKSKMKFNFSKIW